MKLNLSGVFQMQSWHESKNKKKSNGRRTQIGDPPQGRRGEDRRPDKNMHVIRPNA